jgi:hypothetical protein
MKYIFNILCPAILLSYESALMSDIGYDSMKYAEHPYFITTVILSLVMLSVWLIIAVIITITDHDL